MKNILPEKAESIGFLFRSLKQDYTCRLIEKLKQAGYEDLSPSHIYVLSIVIREDGIRLTNIAEKLSVSKQAVKEIIDFLENKNYLMRTSDPDDLRAKKVNLTELGKKLQMSGKKASEEIKKEYISIIGKEAFEQMENSIKQIISHKKT